MRGLVDRVVEVHRAFTRANVPHAFGGAIAFAYHAEPRATRDIDVNVFVPPEGAAEALRALEAIGVTIDLDRDCDRARRDSQLRVRWGPVPVDLFFSTLDFHEEIRGRIRRVPFAEIEIPILSAEDLAICKVAFDREKDWVDLRELLQIQGAGFQAAYTLRWLDEILGADDQRTRRFRNLLEQSGP